MTSKYVKRTVLLLGGAAMGAAVAAQYRLSTQPFERHPRLAQIANDFQPTFLGESDFSEVHPPASFLSSAVSPSPLAAAWQEFTEYLRIPLEERRRRLYTTFFGYPGDDSNENGAGRGGNPSSRSPHCSGNGGNDLARRPEGEGAGHALDIPYAHHHDSSCSRSDGAAKEQGSPCGISPIAHAQSLSGREDDGGSDASGQESDGAATHLRAVPTDMKSRFLTYARQDPSTGEFVQQVDDFIACVLLLEPHSSPTQAVERRRNDGSDRAGSKLLPALGNEKDPLPLAVQTRMASFFKFVDMDGSHTVSYAEFVMLFTLLSTRRRVLKTAFDVFQHGGEGNESRVNSLEFARLLNVLMVDPSVQIVYDGPAANDHNHHQGGRSPIGNVVPPHSVSPTEDAFFPPEGDNTAPADLAVSLASQTRRARRTRSKEEGKLTFTIPSSTVWRLFRAPPPKHDLAPPGSRHHADNASSKENKDFTRYLDKLSEEDRRRNLLSFDAFWYRMDYLRWELRAIEFGIFDVNNTGAISLADFRSILSHDLKQSLAKKQQRPQSHSGSNSKVAGDAHVASTSADSSRATTSKPRRFFNFGSAQRGSDVPAAITSEPVPPMTTNADDNARVITWQFYQTIFDIIRESHTTLPALRLALDAEPPVQPSQLIAGAIPDGAIHESHAGVKELVVQRQSGNQREAAEARTQQQQLVRPTALTWKQFGQVLSACDAVPNLTPEEEQLFFELFDADRSGTITPEEFAHLCELKRSFFATYLPRFTEPQRNVIQQFVFCMEQLE